MFRLGARASSPPGVGGLEARGPRAPQSPWAGIVGAVAAGALAVALLGTGEGGAAPPVAARSGPLGARAPRAQDQLVIPERQVVDVISVRPHDARAYTQGLLLHEGELYESTGLYGESSLRRVDPDTGEVRQRIDIDAAYFAEGLALVGDRLIQLTYQEHAAFVYRRDTFARTDQFRFDNAEGWGLCYDGKRLVMSDGTGTLTFRNPETFAVVGEMDVTRAGRYAIHLNELECVGDRIYANIWPTDTIVEIDARTGVVTAEIDVYGLLTPEERAQAQIPNGIAWDPATEHFLITGKFWPWLFEVAFVPVETATPEPTASATATSTATPTDTATALPSSTPTATPRPAIYLPVGRRDGG